MAKEDDIKRLIQKGASRRQAVAALAAIGGVADASEAIAAGIFDELADRSSKRNATKMKRTNTPPDVKPKKVLRLQEVSQGSDDEHEFADEDYDDDIFRGDDAASEEASDHDPYRGLDMSKDRSEERIEALHAPRSITVKERQYSKSGKAAKATSVKCIELTQGEWMKGVPHGAEQSFLFEVYQKLAIDPVHCPACRKACKRNGNEFFLLYPDIAQYLRALEDILPHKCSTKGCKTTFCLACGQDWQQHENFGQVKKAATSAFDQESPETLASWNLLHCQHARGAALGVGLAHAERCLLGTQHQVAAEPATKKRKATSTNAKAPVSAKASVNGSNASTSSVAVAASGSEAPTGTVYEEDHSTDSDSDDGENSAYEDEYYYESIYGASGPAGTLKSANSGTGYAGCRAEDYSWQGTSTIRQTSIDDACRRALSRIRAYVPDESRTLVRLADGSLADVGPTSLDYTSEVTLLAQLRRRFLPLASTLLQTQSIADIANRLPIFEELLQWFGLLSRHDSTAALVAQPIMRVAHKEIRPGKSKDSPQEVMCRYEASAGPRELAQTVCDQAQALCRSLERAATIKPQIESTTLVEPEGTPRDHCEALASPKALPKSSHKKDKRNVDKEEAAGDECERVVGICRSIVKSVGTMDAALSRIKGPAFLQKLLASINGGEDSNGTQQCDGNRNDAKKSGGDEKDNRRAYRAWAKATIWDEVDMTAGASSLSSSTPTYLHAYAKDITESRAYHSSARNLTISKEVAGFSAALPADWESAIFVRSDESRMDVLKAMIVGPPFSPYKDGLFEFDIFLPTTYNQTPPNVKIVTTNGGLVRFGPNLYADGKVCLSLLGTWAGPGWDPGKSTILQVLLSISSMVMGEEEPAVNEPGWASYKGTAGSKRYNFNLRRQTVRHAMLNQLKKPTAVWDSVIKGHFKHKRAALLKQLGQWLDEDDGREYYSDGATVIHLSASSAAYSSSVSTAAADAFSATAAAATTSAGGSANTIAFGSLSVAVPTDAAAAAAPSSSKQAQTTTTAAKTSSQGIKAQSAAKAKVKAGQDRGVKNGFAKDVNELKALLADL